MKKGLVVFCFLVMAALGNVAEAAAADCPTDGTKPCITFFDAIATSADVGPYTLSGYYKVSYQVSSATTSVATVILYRRNTSADPWIPVLQIDNPSSTQQGYDLPPAGQIRVVLTHTSGTITGTLVRTK